MLFYLTKLMLNILPVVTPPGPLSPKEVEDRLVSRSGARLHKWLWKVLSRLRHDINQDYEDDLQLGRVRYNRKDDNDDQAPDVPMIPNSAHHPNSHTPHTDTHT